MPLFRIAPEKFLENYTGPGGSFEDGARWNLPQTPVMYFGLTASVAMLEMANYTASPRKVPPFCRLGLQGLDDDAAISELIESDLPEDWSVFPCPESTRETGNQWLQPDSPPAGGRPGHCSAAPPAEGTSMSQQQPMKGSETTIGQSDDMWKRRSVMGYSVSRLENR